ncbi:MAG: ATP-binding protein [Vicinamibacteria bacterium]|nr:ATP-binding protein [Vicinamibacteria bacterium]
MNDRDSFHDRVRLEAARYGKDAWIFVRELLQNARDADATRVEIEVEARGDGRARIGFLDDGFGMSLGHARRFLFTLYASSKHDDRDAGRFGVGFWSVLRFKPERIVVRSWPAHDESWEIELDGALRNATRRVPPRRETSGTEILLDRAMDSSELERRVFDAGRVNARFLTQRRNPRRSLAVRVNGRTLNEPFDLPPPSLGFEDRNRRGVVSLGSSPRVELHAHGLLVRMAYALDDLLSRDEGKEIGHGWPQQGTDGMAPQAILDDSRLDLLLARGDARNEREVARLVKRARSSLRRLVRRQIDRVRPRSLRQRAGDAVGALRSWSDLVLMLSSVTLALGIFAGAFLWSRSQAPRRSVETTTAAGSAPEAERARQTTPHRDLGALYAGPRSGVSETGDFELALRYRPAESSPFFAALVVFDPDSPPGALLHSDLAGDYRGAECRRDCMEIEVMVAARPGPVRLPCPVGHRIANESVRLDGRQVPLRATRHGEPVLVVGPGVDRDARVVYRAGPASDDGPVEEIEVTPRVALEETAASLSTMPVEERVEAAARWVGARVRYSTEDERIRRQASSVLRADSFVDRALAIGAGDCDVQNGVLVALLQDSGVTARLVIGYVGRMGSARGLHAWAEYRIGASWATLDLTARGDAESAAAIIEAEPPLEAASREDTPVVSASSDPGAWRFHMPAFLGVLASGMVAAVILLRSRRRERTVRYDPRFGLVSLVRGALERPEAFRETPEVFWRPLLPILPRGTVSLGEAWSLAERGRLYSARRRSALPMRASQTKNRVLDAAHAESALAASALGATPLDEWDERLSRGRSSPLLGDASSALSRRGERWRLTAVSNSSRDALPETRDVRGLTLETRSFWSGGSFDRYVVVDARAPWLIACERRHAARPAEAVFDLIDRVLDALGCPEPRRLELLAPLARAALRERAAR